MVSTEFDLALAGDRNSHSNLSHCRSTRKNCIAMIKSKLMYVLLIMVVLCIIAICIVSLLIYEKSSDVTQSVDAWKDNLSPEQRHWYDAGLDELKHGLKVEMNTHRARNVILFVGDGMGVNTATASRIYRYGEEGRLSWEEFPHMGMLKVSNFKGSLFT